MPKKKQRMTNEVNAGSMADIAFLLLIFFLVTTQIVEDKGIRVNLPPWSDEPPPELQFAKNNVYSILVNANNQLLVDGELAKVSDLREGIKRFILNNGANPEWSDSPVKAIVSLQNDRGTKYKTYIEVYDEVKGAYLDIYRDVTQDRFGVTYDPSAISAEIEKYLKDNYPINLSEAEPTTYGEEG